MSTNDWQEWSRHVLAEIKRFDRSYLHLYEKLDQVEDRMDKYNEILIKNTFTLEEHVRRTHLLEQKMEHVEEEVDGLKDHVNFVNGVFRFFGSEKGQLFFKVLIFVVGAAISYAISKGGFKFF